MSQKRMTSLCAWSHCWMSAVLIRRFGSCLICLVLLASMISSDPMQPRGAGAEESEPPRSVLLPTTPKTWSLTHSVHPGGPEGMKMNVAEVALNQDGEFNKVTFLARKPKEATRSVSQLSVEEREDYLRQFAAALESFSFEPAMEGWADSDTVTLSLKSGRRSMEVEIKEIRGETNLEFRSRIAKFLKTTTRTDTIKKHVQPDLARRFARVADAWRMSVTLELGTTRLYRIDVEGSAWRTKFPDPTIQRIHTITSPGQLRVQEFEPGIVKPLATCSADLKNEVQQKFLERGLTTLRDFAFPAEDEAAEGNIAVSLKLDSWCLSAGDAARKLTIKQSGLTAAQFDKSAAAELIRLVNERVPEENRIRWE